MGVMRIVLENLDLNWNVFDRPFDKTKLFSTFEKIRSITVLSNVFVQNQPSELGPSTGGASQEDIIN
jgi:hypothetical protein